MEVVVARAAEHVLEVARRVAGLCVAGRDGGITVRRVARHSLGDRAEVQGVAVSDVAAVDDRVVAERVAEPDGVGTGLAVEVVVAATARQCVSTFAAAQHVVACSAGDRVVGIPATEVVRTSAAVDRVGTGSTPSENRLDDGVVDGDRVSALAHVGHDRVEAVGREGERRLARHGHRHARDVRSDGEGLGHVTLTVEAVAGVGAGVEDEHPFLDPRDAGTELARQGLVPQRAALAEALVEDRDAQDLRGAGERETPLAGCAQLEHAQFRRETSKWW